jgi:hypothetical protein
LINSEGLGKLKSSTKKNEGWEKHKNVGENIKPIVKSDIKRAT